MKQILQNMRDGHIRIGDVPPPRGGPGDVVVRTAHSLISSGTERSTLDVARSNLVRKALKRPEQAKKALGVLRTRGPFEMWRLVQDRLDREVGIGYSLAGTVLEVGSSVRDIGPGDRVACGGAGHASHATIVSVPRNLVTRVPDGVSTDRAATATVGAIALHGFRQTGASIGDRVVVVGCGLVGLLAVQILRAAGARVFAVDVDARALETARGIGAEEISVPGEAEAKVHRWSGGAGADAVLVTAGGSSTEPVRLAGSVARDRGRVVILGRAPARLEWSTFYHKELEVRYSRSYGPGRYDPVYEEGGIDYPLGYVRWTEERNFGAYLQLVADGHIDLAPIITHRFHIDEAPAAYDLLEAGEERVIGIIVDYGTEVEEDRRSRIDLAPVPTLRRDSLRVGFVGAGNFARDRLLPPLAGADGVDLAGVVTRSGASAEQVARRFGFAFCSSDPAEVIESPEVDVVFIGTRHDTHADYARRALEAGKHVFVEKPLALTREQLGPLIEWAGSAGDRAGPILMVGFNRRFAPLVIGAREVLADRSVVLAHLRVSAGRLPSDHWFHDLEVGGGRLLAEGCHFVDLARHLVGAPIERVSARSLVSGVDLPSTDSFLIRLEFADGQSGVVEYLSAGGQKIPKEYVEIHADTASVVLDDYRRATIFDGAKRRRRRLRKQDKGHRAEIAAFLAACRGTRPPPVPVGQLLETSAATLAAQESLVRGRPIHVLDVLDDLEGTAGIRSA